MSVDIFAMAFQENAKLSSDSQAMNAKAKAKINAKKAMTESIIKTGSKVVKENIALNKIRFTEDVDDINIQPSEDIMVIYSDDITPEMTEEEVEKAAEELVGSTVCKCGVCGANYIGKCEHADADNADEFNDEELDSLIFSDEDLLDDATNADDDEFTESLLFTEAEELDADIQVETDEDVDDPETENIECDTTCPVCNATENQVEVGTIAPTETEADDASDDTNSDDDNSDDDTESDDVNDSDSDDGDKKSDDDEPDDDTNSDDEELTEESIDFRESAFNILLNKFVRENYKNVKSIKITKGGFSNGEITLEGIVNTQSGKQRDIKFSSVKFNYTEGLMNLKLREVGPFTESVQLDKNRVPFVLECKAASGKVLPVALKYNYVVTEGKSRYKVYGKVALGK